MPVPTIDDLHATWSRRALDTSVGENGALSAAVLGRLADGLPADPEHLATAADLPIVEVTRLIEAAAEAGYEVENGAIVGAALTLNPTPNRFRVRGNDLYTWCGFDALFLPLLLDERAEVHSPCPVTGEAIHLTIEADGSVHEVAPSTAVIAIAGSEVASPQTTGPDSDSCIQMPFLSSAEAGRAWLQERDGIAVVPLDTAMQVARNYAGSGW